MAQPEPLKSPLSPLAFGRCACDNQGVTETPTISNKQRAFVEYYCGQARWSATEAARLSGYAQPHSQGPRLLENVGVKAAIRDRMAELAMTAEEIVLRLREHATASLDDFTDEDGSLNLRKARRAGRMHLVKKLTVKPREHGQEISIELHDAQAALVHLGRHLGLFNNDDGNFSRLSDAALLALIQAGIGGGGTAGPQAAGDLPAPEPDTLLPALPPPEAD